MWSGVGQDKYEYLLKRVYEACGKHEWRFDHTFSLSPTTCVCLCVGASAWIRRGARSKSRGIRLGNRYITPRCDCVEILKEAQFFPMHSSRYASSGTIPSNKGFPVRTPKVVRFKGPSKHLKTMHTPEKQWDATTTDLSRYKISNQEFLRRKQSRRSPVNSGPHVKTPAEKGEKPLLKSEALTPSKIPPAHDHLGKVTWRMTGKNTSTKSPTRAVNTPSTVNNEDYLPSSVPSMRHSYAAPKTTVPDSWVETPSTSRVASRHSSLAQTSKAWDVSRIERSASKKAAAAIAKAESKAKSQSLQLTHVHMNQLEQGFHALQGQIDKLRRISGRTIDWCKVDSTELGKERNIVSYVDSLVQITADLTSVISEHEIRAQQSKDDLTEMQQLMLKMQTDMVQIREQQEHHADVMEFINNSYTKRDGIGTLQPGQEQPTSPSKGVQAELDVPEHRAFYEESPERYDDFNTKESEGVMETSEDNFEDMQDDIAIQATSPDEPLELVDEQEVYAQIGQLNEDDLRALIESEGVTTSNDQDVDALRTLLVNLMNQEVDNMVEEGNEEDEEFEYFERPAPPLPTALPTRPAKDTHRRHVHFSEEISASPTAGIGRMSSYDAYLMQNQPK